MKSKSNLSLANQMRLDNIYRGRPLFKEFLNAPSTNCRQLRPCLGFSS